MNKTRWKRCGYCGDNDVETRDHIPPKGLFPKPRPSDLITVPCCKACQSDWSDDDEYFRTVLLTAENLADDKRAQQQMDVAARSVHKHTKSGFAKMINDSLTEVEVRTPAGVIVRKQPAVKIDHPRIARVLERIIRALFHREIGEPVPGACTVEARLDQYGELCSQLSKSGGFNEVRWAADRMFLYTFGQASDNPHATIWLGAFFEQVCFAGFTGLGRGARTRKDSQYS